MTKFATALTVILAASIAATPEAVHAKVLTAEAREAARVMELSVMFSSVALRCKTIGIDLQPDYAKFSARQKAALSRADAALKLHFDVQTKADLRARFDQFQIQVLNYYGTGQTDQPSCGMFSKLMNMLAEADEVGGLLAKIAEIMVVEPLLKDDR